MQILTPLVQTTPEVTHVPGTWLSWVLSSSTNLYVSNALEDSGEGEKPIFSLSNTLAGTTNTIMFTTVTDTVIFRLVGVKFYHTNKNMTDQAYSEDSIELRTVTEGTGTLSNFKVTLSWAGSRVCFVSIQ